MTAPTLRRLRSDLARVLDLARWERRIGTPARLQALEDRADDLRRQIAELERFAEGDAPRAD
jgi:hypothetical protein